MTEWREMQKTITGMRKRIDDLQITLEESQLYLEFLTKVKAEPDAQEKVFMCHPEVLEDLHAMSNVVNVLSGHIIRTMTRGWTDREMEIAKQWHSTIRTGRSSGKA
jgi:hypothetical protein